MTSCHAGLVKSRRKHRAVFCGVDEDEGLLNVRSPLVRNVSSCRPERVPRLA
jgi:hypothetical protein